MPDRGISMGGRELERSPVSQLKNPPDVGLVATALDVANLEAPKLAAWF